MATARSRFKLIAALIKMFHDVDDADPTYIDFTTEFSMSPKTVCRTLREMEYQGVLNIQRRRGMRNEYRINGVKP